MYKRNYGKFVSKTFQHTFNYTPEMNLKRWSLHVYAHIMFVEVGRSHSIKTMYPLHFVARFTELIFSIK